MADDETGDEKRSASARSRNLVRNSDIVVLVGVGLVGIVVLIVFGAAVFRSNLIIFPDMSRAADPSAFFNDTLVYRERRVALSLVLRTFVTGFSFIVGLALCTMGGMFILRQVNTLTSISGGMSSGLMNLLSGSSEEQGKRLKEMQFSFASYSPGVVFMVGGVLIMGLTQYFAISVTTIEVIPQGVASSYCFQKDSLVWFRCDDLAKATEQNEVQAGADTGSKTLISSTSSPGTYQESKEK